MNVDRSPIIFDHDGVVENGHAIGIWGRVAFRLRKRRSRTIQQRLANLGWYEPGARSDDDAVFIGGCGRSGTTLFREMLNRHPRIACGPETSMFGLPFDAANLSSAWGIELQELMRRARRTRTLVEFAERFYREFLLEPAKKPRWADKTPNNVRVIEKLLTWFPYGRFIHLVRDGRDVVCSLRHHPKEKIVNGQLVPTRLTNSIAKCAMRWLTDTSHGLAFQSHPRCLMVKYEELVADPERQMRRVCKFLGEDYDPVVLNSDAGANRNIKMVMGRLVNNSDAVRPISSKSIGRWRQDLNPSERQTFVDIAGELLIALGYVVDHFWVDEPYPSSDGVEKLGASKVRVLLKGV